MLSNMMSVSAVLSAPSETPPPHKSLNWRLGDLVRTARFTTPIQVFIEPGHGQVIQLNGLETTYILRRADPHERHERDVCHQTLTCTYFVADWHPKDHFENLLIHRAINGGALYEPWDFLDSGALSYCSKNHEGQYRQFDRVTPANLFYDVASVDVILQATEWDYCF